MLFESKTNRNFELTQRALDHIKQRHPIMKAHLEHIAQVLEHPDEIRYSVKSKDVLLFYKYFANIEGGKYLVVVGKINKRNLILTTYLTDKIKSGEIYEP